jgi:hypothetical protein
LTVTAHGLLVTNIQPTVNAGGITKEKLNRNRARKSKSQKAAEAKRNRFEISASLLMLYHRNTVIARQERGSFRE